MFLKRCSHRAPRSFGVTSFARHRQVPDFGVGAAASCSGGAGGVVFGFVGVGASVVKVFLIFGVGPGSGLSTVVGSVVTVVAADGDSDKAFSCSASVKAVADANSSRDLLAVI